MSKKLEGKVAVVTGGNSGIGLATARRFVAEGAHVFITGRRQAALDQAVNLSGRNVTAVRGDVSSQADLDRLYAAVREQKGRIDVLFANAGVADFGPLGEITEEHFDWIFGTNVRGLLFCVQKALPLVRDGGSIILNASIATPSSLPSSSATQAPSSSRRGWSGQGEALRKTWVMRTCAGSPETLRAMASAVLLSSLSKSRPRR
jgi:NAD(P)-dependent dehydrogenase (short-subunit alcohol dehydrogenase family)